MYRPKADNPPECYGKLCDPGDTKCAGGPDPAYEHPVRKNHVRDACDYFSSCATRTQASRQGFVPAQNLVRPYPGAPPQVQMAQPGQPPQPMVYGQQQMMPVNYQMPGYLTTPEDPNANSLGKRMFIYSFRAMFKGLFHALAHAFDSESFGARTPPPVVQAPPPPPPTPPTNGGS